MNDLAPPAPEGSSERLLECASRIADEWEELDVVGALWTEHLDSGETLGFRSRQLFPLASVAKVPIGLVVADRCARGRLDAARPIVLEPARRGPGATGISALRHPVTMAVADLVHQMLSVSDNAAADALLDVVGIADVAATLREWGFDDLTIRHDLRTLYDCATQVAGDDFALATELAVTGGRDGGEHVIESLDVHRGNVGTARSCVELLRRIWTDDLATPEACAAVRTAMEQQVFAHRLSSELRADDVIVAGKTGTFLHLRHEIGVITHHRTRVAVAALTASRRTARVRADVDLAIGRAARDALEALR